MPDDHKRSLAALSDWYEINPDLLESCTTNTQQFAAAFTALASEPTSKVRLEQLTDSAQLFLYVANEFLRAPPSTVGEFDTSLYGMIRGLATAADRVRELTIGDATETYGELAVLLAHAFETGEVSLEYIRQLPRG